MALKRSCDVKLPKEGYTVGRICGEAIPDHMGSKLSLKTGGRSAEHGSRSVELDLCESCTKRLMAFLGVVTL